MASTSGGSVTQTFALNTVRHGHLIEYLDEIRAKEPGGVSRVIREALEMYIQQSGRQPAVLTAGDIEAACQSAIERALQGRLVEVTESADSELPTQRPETQAAGNLRQMQAALKEWE